MDKFFANARVQAAFLATFPLKDNDTPEEHVKRYLRQYAKRITEDFERTAATETAIKNAIAAIVPLQD